MRWYIVQWCVMLLVGTALQAQVDHTPKISTRNAFVQPIMNNNDPEFRIGRIAVQIPGLSWADSARRCVPRVTITSSTVRDLKTNETYAVNVVSTSAPVQASQQWRLEDRDTVLDHSGYIVTFDALLTLAGTPIPLRKGMVKGNVSVLVEVVYTDEDGRSYTGRRKFPITISN